MVKFRRQGTSVPTPECTRGEGTLPAHHHPHTYPGLHPHHPNLLKEGGQILTLKLKASCQGVGP